MNTSLIIDFVSTLEALILVIGGITGLFLLLEGINVYLDGKEQKRRGFLKRYVFPESYHAEVMKRFRICQQRLSTLHSNNCVFTLASAC
jgi:hypothetical protein